MHQDGQTSAWSCRLRKVVREGVSKELTTNRDQNGGKGHREGSAGRQMWQLRASWPPRRVSRPWTHPNTRAGYELPEGTRVAWPHVPRTQLKQGSCPYRVLGTCLPHSPRCSQQPPPLPGMSSVPGPEHVEVIRIVWAGGGRALTRVWGSLKQNPGGGSKSDPPAGMASSHGQQEGSRVSLWMPCTPTPGQAAPQTCPC